MLHAERLSPSRSLCIAQTNTRRPVHSFFRIPFHSTTTGQRMQEINELLSRQQYVFFTRSPVERNRVCVGSGLDRSASTAFRLLQTSNLCQAERSRPFLMHIARVGKHFLPYFIILMPRKVYSMATLKNVFIYYIGISLHGRTHVSARGRHCQFAKNERETQSKTL